MYYGTALSPPGFQRLCCKYMPSYALLRYAMLHCAIPCNDLLLSTTLYGTKLTLMQTFMPMLMLVLVCLCPRHCVQHVCMLCTLYCTAYMIHMEHIKHRLRGENRHAVDVPYFAP